MTRVVPHIIAFLLLAFPGRSQLAFAEVETGTHVTATLVTGRVVTGWVDDRTSADWLWLSIGHDQVVLSSGLPMSEVLLVKPTSPLRAFSREPTLSLPLAGPLSAPLPAMSRVRDASATVQWIDVSAAAANWDRDAMDDGLQLWVLPRNQAGRVIPVRGRVDVRLVTVQSDGTGGRHIERKPRFRELGRWSQQISPDSLIDGGYLLTLPFRSFDQHRDSHISHLGVVNVRLAVPGQGTFEASDGWLVLRPPSPLRDELQQWRGRRSIPRDLSFNRHRPRTDLNQ